MGVGEVPAYTKPGQISKENAKIRDGVALNKRILFAWLKITSCNSVIE